MNLYTLCTKKSDNKERKKKVVLYVQEEEWKERNALNEFIKNPYM